MALLEQWRNTRKNSRTDPRAWNSGRNISSGRRRSTSGFWKASPGKNTVKGYADKYGVDLMTMVGFLDGINDSLKEKNPLEALEEDTEVNLNYDKELLYKNMVEAKAEWLYTLPQWDKLIPERAPQGAVQGAKALQNRGKGSQGGPQRSLPLRERKKI